MSKHTTVATQQLLDTREVHGRYPSILRFYAAASILSEAIATRANIRLLHNCTKPLFLNTGSFALVCNTPEQLILLVHNMARYLTPESKPALPIISAP